MIGEWVVLHRRKRICRNELKGFNMLPRLNAFGSSYPTPPKIVVYTQPPNSPDFNACDLGFFRSFSQEVFKERRVDCSVFDKEQLVADVQKVWDSYPVEKLGEVWEYKTCVMRKVANPAIAGGNVYDKRRKTTPGYQPKHPAKRRRHDARS